MILPSKYVPTIDSTLGIAATLLTLREPNQTVSALWNSFREERDFTTFDLFCEGLTLLFLLGAVDFKDGLLEWLV